MSANHAAILLEERGRKGPGEIGYTQIFKHIIHELPARPACSFMTFVSWVMGSCLFKLLDAAATSSAPLALDSTRGYLMRRPWRLASVAIVRMLFGVVVVMGNGRLAYLLVDEHGNDQDGDEENNNEDNNDTRLALGPVLVTLGELVEGVLGASGDGHADGGHCGCRFLRDESQM